MKKFFDRIMVLMIVMAFAALMYGCGSKDSAEAPADSKTESPAAPEAEDDSKAEEEPEKEEKKSEEAPKIEDIEWSIEEGIVDGDRKVVMNITNNSEVALAGFDINFTEKDGITEEEKDGFFGDLKEKFEATDDDLEQLKGQEISMHAGTERILSPGESITTDEIYYYQGYFYMKDMDHYALVSPDLAEISYVDGDKIYKEYYDFKNDKYSKDDKTEDAKYWTKSALGTVVPKPEVPVIKDGGLDKEDCFMFDAFGMTPDDFNAYVESCKDMGYTVDPSEFDGYYSADNAEGYNVHMNYDNVRYSASVTVNAPDGDGGNSNEMPEGAPGGDMAPAAPDPEAEEEEVDASKVTASVREALDEYEAFFDDYIAFMKKYNNADYKDLDEMIDDYSDYINKYSDMYSKLLDMAGDLKITSDDYKYYSSVLKRIEKKLEAV